MNKGKQQSDFSYFELWQIASHRVAILERPTSW